MNQDCSTNNKNPETDIGVQSEDQQSKAAKPLDTRELLTSMKSSD